MNRFVKDDNIYFEKRESFAKNLCSWGGKSDNVSTTNEISLWSVIDNWPIYVGKANLSRYLAIYELFKKTIDFPGHICELGCYHGSNLLFLAKLVDILLPNSSIEIFGFDSFEGLKTFEDEKDPEISTNFGKYKGNIELLESSLSLYDLEEMVTLIKGDILETLPSFLKERKDIRFSLIYCDLDLYSPTKKAIELLYPLLVRGGIMIFDEYNMEKWPGETSAVHEILGQNIRIFRVPYTRQPTAYIIKE